MFNCSNLKIQLLVDHLSKQNIYIYYDLGKHIGSLRVGFNECLHYLPPLVK